MAIIYLINHSAGKLFNEVCSRKVSKKRSAVNTFFSVFDADFGVDFLYQSELDDERSELYGLHWLELDG